MCASKGVLNHQAFSALNEESCYWAGFLYGDGCVSETKKGQHSIQISTKDKEAAEAFSLFVSGSVVRVKECSTKLGSWYRVRVASDIMAEDLKKFGVVPRKTYEKRFDVVDLGDNMVYFLKGCFDSDGSIGLYYFNGYPAHKVNFNGTFSFASFVHTVLEKLGFRSSVNKAHAIFRVNVWRESQKDFYTICILPLVFV